MCLLQRYYRKDEFQCNPLNPVWSFISRLGADPSNVTPSVSSPIGSTISASAAADILQYFGTTNETLGTLMTTIYLLGYAFGPLAIAPLSELYGRSVVFRTCAVLFTIFNVACAVSNSLGSLIAYRLLAGIAGSCAGTLGASSIADMIVREKRGAAMSAYVMGPTFGPTIGPIVGGYLTPAAGWRWGFWVMTIASGVMAFLILFFLPESYAYAILKKKTEKLRKSTGNPNLRSALDTTTKTPRQLFAFAILRPLKMLISPIVFLMSLYAAIVFSYAYLCFTTFPRVFKDQYGFSSGASGLANIGIGTGFIVGLLFCGAVSDRWSAYLTRKNNGVAKSEYRLPLLIVGAFFVPVGLFWYGWIAEYRAHWIVPIIGTSFLGIGIVMAYVSLICEPYHAATLTCPSVQSTNATYLVDAYTVYSASVLAASAILRCLFGALLPLAGNAMFNTLGVGWGNSLLGFISLAFLPVPLILYRYGEHIRESPFLKMEF